MQPLRFGYVLASLAAFVTVLTAVVLVRGLYVDQRQGTINKLGLLWELRESALQQYLRTLRSEVVSWSAQPITIVTARSFVNAWKSLGENAGDILRARYIDKNPYSDRAKFAMPEGSDDFYDTLHGEMHPKAVRLLQNLGYYDLFLINPAGDVVYTVKKEEDFATNLMQAPWKDTGLAKAFRAALNYDTPNEYRETTSVGFTDYAPYGPSDDRPAAFLANRIVHKTGTLIGALAIQVPIDRVNDILRFTEGMGESGETYVVGEDLLMRSDSRFSAESTILKTSVDTESTRQALRGLNGAIVTDDYRGVSVFSAYGPFTFESVRWLLLAEIDEAEAMTAINRKRNIILGTAGAVLAMLGLFAAIMMFGRRNELQPTA